METLSALKQAMSTPQALTNPTPPITPPPLSSPAHDLLQEIQTIHAALESSTSLSPSPQINTLLNRLVNLCIEPYNQTFTHDFLSLKPIEALCTSLRPLCAAAEGELERYWAARILDLLAGDTSINPREALSSFPYHQNYIDLSRLECCVLEAHLPSTRSPRNIAFIGSGPLPLTSFCILDRYPNAVVHNIDRDGEALRISGNLAKMLGYGGMRFVCEDVSVGHGESAVIEANGNGTRGEWQEHTPWSALDVVFLAALVGMDTVSKLSILASLAGRLEPGTLVVVRSARGLRGVLYPVLELSDELRDIGYEILVEVHPWGKVVNSVIVLRVR